MDNEKWVWADEENLGPLALPLLDKKLTPIFEWNSLQPPAPEQPQSSVPAEVAPEPTPPLVTPARPPAPTTRRNVPPSVVRAIVLHLEGKLEEAIQELQTGLKSGEPAI